MQSGSLLHIARGMVLMTEVDAWQDWAMAVGIEAAYIVAELAVVLAATDRTRRQVVRWAGPFTAVAMAVSALLNALAFAEHFTGWAKAVPVLIGIMMPVAIYTLTGWPCRSTSTATPEGGGMWVCRRAVALAGGGARVMTSPCRSRCPTLSCGRGCRIETARQDGVWSRRASMAMPDRRAYSAAVADGDMTTALGGL